MPLTWHWLQWSLSGDQSLIATLQEPPSRSEQIAVGEQLTRRLFCAEGVKIDAADLGRTIYGKPQLRYHNQGHLHHSIAHTGCITIGVISADQPVGIDIEHRDRQLNVKAESLSRRLFHSDQEAADCLRNGCLIQAWVAKEAVLKASGFGLTIGMKQVQLAADFRLARCLGQNYTLQTMTYANHTITVAKQMRLDGSGALPFIS